MGRFLFVNQAGTAVEGMLSSGMGRGVAASHDRLEERLPSLEAAGTEKGASSS
jgi:hypothetical protein